MTYIPCACFRQVWDCSFTLKILSVIWHSDLVLNANGIFHFCNDFHTASSDIYFCTKMLQYLETLEKIKVATEEIAKVEDLENDDDHVKKNCLLMMQTETRAHPVSQVSVGHILL